MSVSCPPERRCLFPYACGRDLCDCDPKEVDFAVKDDPDLLEGFSTPERVQAWKDGTL